MCVCVKGPYEVHTLPTPTWLTPFDGSNLSGRWALQLIDSILPQPGHCGSTLLPFLRYFLESHGGVLGLPQPHGSKPGEPQPTTSEFP